MSKELLPAFSIENSSSILPASRVQLKPRPWRQHVTPWDEIASHPPANGEGTTESPYIVDWVSSRPNHDGFVDVEDPFTWTASAKWTATMIAAFSTLTVSMSSSMMSAAIPDIIDKFPGLSTSAYIMITSGFVAGFAVGPLVWAPSSELYGRRIVFVATFIPFTIFSALVCASKNIPAMIIFRCLAGTFGSSAMTNAGGTIADMFSPQQRGLAMAVFACAPFLGPAIGPVAGGFISENGGWQWVAAALAFCAFTLTLIGGLFLPETLAPVLLRRRAKLLSAQTGFVYRIKSDALNPLTPSKAFAKALKTPWGLLFGEPIVAVLSLYLAIIYAILYMSFTAFPLVFENARGWTPGISGLAFVGITIGAFISLAYILWYENPRYTRKMAELGGYCPPEQRLPIAIGGAFLLPVALLIFAWTGTPATIPWIAPVLATLPYGMGIVWVFLATSNYLVDTYLIYAASVLAASTVVRSCLGVILPLFTTDIYTALGDRWAGTMVACLAFLFAPAPIILFYFGDKARRLTKAGRIADDLGKQMSQATQRPSVSPEETP